MIIYFHLITYASLFRGISNKYPSASLLIFISQKSLGHMVYLVLTGKYNSASFNVFQVLEYLKRGK